MPGTPAFRVSALAPSGRLDVASEAAVAGEQRLPSGVVPAVEHPQHHQHVVTRVVHLLDRALQIEHGTLDRDGSGGRRPPPDVGEPARAVARGEPQDRRVLIGAEHRDPESHGRRQLRPGRGRALHRDGAERRVEADAECEGRHDHPDRLAVDEGGDRRDRTRHREVRLHRSRHQGHRGVPTRKAEPGCPAGSVGTGCPRIRSRIDPVRGESGSIPRSRSSGITCSAKSRYVSHEP